jgi:PhnB protein
MAATSPMWSDRPRGARTVTGIEPELWVDRAATAVGFYAAAFGAVPLFQVGEGEDVVARLAVDDARFWVASADPDMHRLGPRQIGGATGRVLLIVEDPDAVVARAVAAGATETAEVSAEHGWRIGRILDPFGHEWEIGREL